MVAVRSFVIASVAARSFVVAEVVSGSLVVVGVLCRALRVNGYCVSKRFKCSDSQFTIYVYFTLSHENEN